MLKVLQFRIPKKKKEAAGSEIRNMPGSTNHEEDLTD